MKRFAMCIVAYALIAACISGCTSFVPSSSVPSLTAATPSSTSEIILNALPYLVQIDGKVYQCGETLAADVVISDEQIAGYTTLSGPGVPDEDGESNFVPVGTPYAPWSTEEYPDTYIILFRYRWFVLHCKDDS